MDSDQDDQLRKKFHADILPSIGRGRFLEVGPGHGVNFTSFGPYFKHAIACDPNPEYLEKTRRRVQEHNSKLEKNITARFGQHKMEDLRQEGVLLSEDLEEGFNYINVLNVLPYFSSKAKLPEILQDLRQSLAKDSPSALLICCMQDKAGPLADAQERVGKGMEFIRAIQSFFEQQAQVDPTLSIEHWIEEERYTCIVPDSVVLKMMSTLIRDATDYTGYEDVNLDEEAVNKHCRDALHDSGAYTGKKNDKGEELVKYRQPIGHILVKSNWH